MKHLVLFASGSGSNVENIHDKFASEPIQIDCVFVNNPHAGVIDRCIRLGIPYKLFNREEWNNGQVLKDLLHYSPDLIVLAGFLWKMPPSIIQSFNQKIINIHPSLLPKFGGKGMYGHFVHEAVIASNEKESGITIHWVNQQYDEGGIIFQSHCEITENDNPESLAQKIHQLEFQYFPEIIKNILNK